MNRIEFMRQLERLLSDISETERREALDYYNSYFDDAGEENESKVIQELGSPGKVAAIIKADLASDSRDYGEYTEQGYRDSRVEEDKKPQVYRMPEYGQTNSRTSGQTASGQSRAERGYQAPPKKNNIGNLILIIAIAVMACIVGAPILLGIGGTLLGIIAAIIGTVLAMGIGAVALVIVGIVFVVYGIVKCVTNPATGLIAIAAGMACLVLGILLALLFAWIAVKFLPWMIRGIVSICQNLLAKVRKKGGAAV